MKKYVLLFILILAFPKIAMASNYSDFGLPNPGILPTNPLYIFKVVRDNFLIAVTQNLENRANLYLFFSNKSLATASELYDMSNFRESGVALEKSVKYLSDSIELSKKLDGEIQKNMNLNYLVAIRAQQELSPKIIQKLEANSQKRLVVQVNSLIGLKSKIILQFEPSK